MYKFETIEQGVSSYISITVPDKAEIDELAIGMMNNNKIDGLLPMSKQWVDQKWVLRYQVSNLFPLSIRIQNLVDEKRFTTFLKGFCDAVLGCGDYLMNSDNLILDEKYVFIDPTTGAPELVYLPLMDVEDQGFPQTFIKNVIHKLVHSLPEGSKLKPILYEYTFEEKFDIRRFRESLDTLKNDIDRINAEAINGKATAPVSGTSYQAFDPAMQSGPSYAAQEPVNASNTVAPSNDLQDEGKKKKGGLFGGGSKEKKEKSKKSNKSSINSLGMAVPGMENPFAQESAPEPVNSIQQESQQVNATAFNPVVIEEGDSGHTIILQQEPESPLPPEDNVNAVNVTEPPVIETPDEDVTQIGDDLPVASSMRLELIESSMPGAPALIDVDTGREQMIIGRISNDEVKPDIAFPREFKKVGRKHAALINRGGEVYLMDLGSVNHTFLNGQMISPNQEYRLKKDDVIMFTASEPVKYKVQ